MAPTTLPLVLHTSPSHVIGPEEGTADENCLLSLCLRRIADSSSSLFGKFSSSLAFTTNFERMGKSSGSPVGPGFFVVASDPAEFLEDEEAVVASTLTLLGTVGSSCMEEGRM